MAIRVRNVALEGFAHDVYTPASIALVGFTSAGAADGSVSVAIEAESPAQTDLATAVVVQTSQPAVGGGGRRHYSWRFDPLLQPEPVPLRPVRASILSGSPSQDDGIAVVVRAVTRARATVVETQPAQCDDVALAALVAVNVDGASPAQNDTVRATALATVRASSDAPAQTDAVVGEVTASAIVEGDAPAHVDTAHAAIWCSASAATESPAQDDRATAAVFRADPRMIQRARERIDWRLADRNAWLAQRGRRAG